MPANKGRSALVLSLLNSLGLLSPDYSPSHRLQVIKPIRATHKELSSYHTQGYLDAVLHPEDSNSGSEPIEVSANYGLEDDCPMFDGISDYVELVGGATLTAAKSLQIANIAICWDGGRFVPLSNSARATIHRRKDITLKNPVHQDSAMLQIVN